MCVTPLPPCAAKKLCWKGIFEKTSHSERDWGLGEAHTVKSEPYESAQRTPFAAIQTFMFGGKIHLYCEIVF